MFGAFPTALKIILLKCYATEIKSDLLQNYYQNWHDHEILLKVSAYMNIIKCQETEILLRVSGYRKVSNYKFFIKIVRLQKY